MINEKALSKKQQRFFGIVRATQKGTFKGETTPQVQRAASSMKMKDVKKFASTKHKGLPEKKMAKEGTCGKGEYYCHDRKKCMPIPKGAKVGKDGMLVKEKLNIGEGSLHKWFKGSKSKDGKGGWVNVVTGGTCASDEPGEGTPKCVSSSKRASMSKSERLSAARRKKKADPGQQSKSGAAKPTYVPTDKPKKKMKEAIETDSSKQRAQAILNAKRKREEDKMVAKKEEVERIDELSNRTMRNYIIKGTKDVAKRASDPDSDEGPKYGKKMKRMDGVMTAADKLARRASKNNKNRYEEKQLDELKASTYKSYIDKAQPAARSLSSKSEVAKKKQGIDRAKDSITGTKKKRPKSRYDIKNYEGQKKQYLVGKEDRKGHQEYGKIPRNNAFREEVEYKEEVVLESDKKGKGSGSKDACYHKVKSRYSVWPSAYASGALVKCRKVGAANWGNSSKKEDYGIISFQDFIYEKCWKGYEKKGMKTMFGKRYPNCVKKEQADLPVDECWKTHKKVGMKMKGGKLVNDCRPKNEAVIGDTKKVGYSTPIDKKKDKNPEPKKAMDAGARGRRLLQRREYRAKVSEFIPKELEDQVQYEAKSPAWQRKAGKNPSGGLNAKGVASYRAANPGSKLKTAVTTKPSKLKKGSKAANRRKSFCARMKGMKKRLTSAKTARDPDSRINKSLRKWNC